MLSHDQKPAKLYHCASVASTEFSRGQGRVEGALCGEPLNKRIWDFATEFVELDLDYKDFERCKVCKNHEDLNLLLLAEAGEDDGI